MAMPFVGEVSHCYWIDSRASVLCFFSLSKPIDIIKVLAHTHTRSSVDEQENIVQVIVSLIRHKREGWEEKRGERDIN